MLKRDEVKYIRDLAKKSYAKADECYICGAEEELQFHHFYSISLLWNKWKKERNIIINSVEQIMELREVFKDEHFHELYTETITLCKFHHMDRLHKIYGKTPPLHTVMKQKRWCDKQRDKFNGVETTSTA